MAVESTLTQIDEHLDTLDDQLRRLHHCRNGGANFSEDLAAATDKRRRVERPAPAESEALLVNMFLYRLRETLSSIAQTTGCKYDRPAKNQSETMRSKSEQLRQSPESRTDRH